MTANALPLPLHIQVLLTELDTIAGADIAALGQISGAEIQKAAATSARYLRLLMAPSDFSPMHNPAFRVAKVEDFFEWHPEKWRKPVGFLRGRFIDHAWAIATPGEVTRDGRDYELRIDWYATQAKARDAQIFDDAAPKADSAPKVEKVVLLADAMRKAWDR